MIKIKNNCIGCGACIAIAPENFEFNDKGIAIVVDDNISEETKEAAKFCPVEAIDIK